MQSGQSKLLTVSQFNAVVKSILENDELLSGVTIRGEISNFKAYPSGHFYFTLKDEASALPCVMFAGSNRLLRFRPDNGIQVRVRGSASVYVKDGRYQFIVSSMEPDGVGGLYAAYEKLKEKLQKEGLFDASHKKEPPFFPRRVGVITSGAGAAFHDICNVTRRRFPQAQILLYPSAVQGAEAPAALAAGVRWFTEKKNVDVLIIGRGGGSIEDLWAFNDETLARTLYACPIPTISAVGHETDFTICDFVCDKRAPTPSAAAEIAVPDALALRQENDQFSRRLSEALQGQLRRKAEELSRLGQSRVLRDRAAPVQAKKEALSALSAAFSKESARLWQEKKKTEESLRGRLAALRLSGRIEAMHRDLNAGFTRLSAACLQGVQTQNARLRGLEGKLTALSPQAVLRRGFAAVFDAQGRVIQSACTLRAGQGLQLHFADGQVETTVSAVRRKEKEE